jgi:Rps23 Pro-64 3,4-dihydroxylase Tpa1-like proline 4-hydroxylase
MEDIFSPDATVRLLYLVDLHRNILGTVGGEVAMFHVEHTINTLSMPAYT